MLKKKKPDKITIRKKITLTFSIMLSISLLSSSIITFFVMKKRVEEEFKASAKQTLEQSKEYIDLINQSVEANSLQILSDSDLIISLTNTYEDEYEKNKVLKETSKKISNMTSIGDNPIISTVTLFNEVGNSVSSVGGTAISSDKLEAAKGEEWYTLAKEAKGRAVWIPLHRDTIIDGGNSKEYISNVRLLTSVNGREAGILKININTEVLYKYMESGVLGESGHIRIIDKNGYIIFDKQEVKPGDKELNSYFEKITDKESGFLTTTVDSEKVFVMYETSKTTGWKFVALVPVKELYSTAVGIGIINLIIVLMFLIISIITTALISRQISRPLNSLVGNTKQLAEGDFTVTLSSSDISEMDELSNNFNEMVNKLKKILNTAKNLSLESTSTAIQLYEISQSIKNASDTTSQSISSIAAGSLKQTGELSNCVEFTRIFNEQITTTNQYMNSIQDTTKDTLMMIEEKSKIIDELRRTSFENKDTIQEVSNTISKLDESTKDILTILKTINDITDRTNLLALNAAIEAAKAGEVGKGFAVVANEVKKLADQSKNSSTEIKNIIKNIQKGIQASVYISEKARRNFLGECEKVDNTIEAFKLIKTSFDYILSLVNETNSSIDKLERDKLTLIHSVDCIALISQDNCAATEEVSATMEEAAASTGEMFMLSSRLAEKSMELSSIIEKFKL